MANKMRGPWYSEQAGFFGPKYLKEYEQRLTTEKNLKEIEFLRKVLGRKKLRILDVPCGHGRHSIGLAKAGHSVTGFDLNKFFLSKAKSIARREKTRINWIQGDMREIPFVEEFDVVLNLFTSFGYLENEKEDEVALQAMIRALRPNGIFVLDFINRENLFRRYRERDWKILTDGSLLLLEREYDPLSGIQHERRNWKFRNKEWSHDIPLRLYSATELLALLEKNGLRVENSFGDYDDTPLSLDSKRCILIARKIRRSC